MKKNGFVIKSIAEHRMPEIIDWAEAEGWNPGLYDAECFYATDPQGIFYARMDGEPVGCISAIKYTKHFGFIGLFIVRPEFRGQGFGSKLWDTALGYLGARNIGLDGVPEQQEKYKKSGFRLAHRNIRFAGTGLSGIETGSNQIVNIDKVRFPALMVYDKAMFLASRPHFLKRWIKQSDTSALAILEDDRIAGYGVIRPCRNGYKIGPLFADSEKFAEQLLFALFQQAGGKTVSIDVPEINRNAMALAERFGMTPVFETARMYNHEPPRLPLQRIYGITSTELG